MDGKICSPISPYEVVYWSNVVQLGVLVEVVLHALRTRSSFDCVGEDVPAAKSAVYTNTIPNFIVMQH